MKAKTENKSFIRAWKLNMRALKLLHGEMPGWFTATILNGLLAAAAPYAAIWFSARLIAELCGGRDVNVLTRYVILILASAPTPYATALSKNCLSSMNIEPVKHITAKMANMFFMSIITPCLGWFGSSCGVLFSIYFSNQ